MAGQEAAVSAAANHVVSDRSPTQLMAAHLHLPAGWIGGIEQYRRPARSARQARRAWVLEQLCLALIVICLAPCFFYVVTGDLMRAGFWLAGSMYHVLCYTLNLRGRGSIFLALVLPTLPLSLLGTTTESGVGYAPACLLMAMLLSLCSISESTVVTGAYGVFLTIVSTLIGVVMDAPHADVINVATVMTVAGGIATVGSQVWTLTHRRTTVAMADNIALAAQLRQANHELEAANEDLAGANHRLLESNALLERRVMERTRELHELSIRDELTGLHNRRHFMERLEQEAACDDGMSLLMIDVDHFKAINDTCGHSVGDLVLRTLANVMAGHLGQGNSLARIGGEEFAVLIPAADESVARPLAEGLRRAVEDIEWPTHIRPLPRQVTISLGLATTAGAHPHPIGLLQDADAALYASKRNGRNRVTSAASIGTYDRV